MTQSWMRGVLAPMRDGDFEVEYKTIKEGERLFAWHPDRGSFLQEFDEPHDIVVLNEYGDGSKICWMSDTPLEINTAMPFIEKAYGDVLIGGLGMGLVPAMISELSPAVSSITIIENNPSVINMVAGQLAMHLPFPEIEIQQNDIWNFLAETDQVYDCIWGDVWPDMFNARDEAAAFRAASQRCLRHGGFSMVWTEDFWPPLEERIGILEQTISVSDGAITMAPCCLCAKSPHLDISGFCMDCCDGLFAKEQMKREDNKLRLWRE